MSDEHAMARLPIVAMVSVAYFAGVLFHLKYVVIFGLPSLFALIDNMRPPGPPICISRVSMYSKMWRYFDRGLYQFLLRQVYLPFVSPSFALWRKLFALCLSYSFVVAWHGSDSHYLRWVVLSGVEVALEMLGSWMYMQPCMRRFCEHRFSPLMLRRVIALLQDICTATGLFGVFYFLGDEGVGQVIAERLLLHHGIRLHYILWHLIALGYCYNNLTIEIDLMLEERAKEKDKKQ